MSCVRAWKRAREHTPCTRRVLPALVLNFMDESGSLSDVIDLEQYRKQNHTHITNAVVQELADLIPTMTSLNIAGCFEVTDVGLWCVHACLPRLNCCYSCNIMLFIASALKLRRLRSPFFAGRSHVRAQT